MDHRKEQAMGWGRLGLFAGGVLFGTAGIGILSSRDAKKVYTHCTAAALRCKDEVMKRKDILQENCSDIYEDAMEMNEKRAEERRQQEYEDAKARVAAFEATENA